MATREELQDEAPFDLDRLPVGPDRKASEDALAVLEELEGQHVTVERVAAYARQKVDGRIATKDLLRALQHADGRLALVTWSNAGINAVGYLPEDQRFDVGGFSGVQKRMGNDPEFYETATMSAAKDQLAWSKPDVVHREESDLLPALEESR